MLVPDSRHACNQSSEPCQARRRGNAASSPVVTIVFRPAALDKLDKDMVNIRIPAIPTKADDQQPTAYYFGMIRQVRRCSCHGLAANAVIQRGLGLGVVVSDSGFSAAASGA